ncbi:Dehydrogenase [Pirellulimonas nuda]|uniref:Dehydrogenase n=1 Tax=Pirellulimonas nuda TaxID=2528009 RepID=A0A518DF24_9BACT|nr:Gfo/Idh/MocA family oxidoreductase [Pirellulimonas nuda]QDU90081.1 Dehydrogenase [Pirellulimonas nuda]
MTPIRIAIVGAGRLGTFHARQAAELEALEVVAVCDPFQASREKLAAEIGVEPVADYRSLIGRVDAAVIATPTVSHFEVASRLLEAGVHALVEKPVTPTCEQANELVELAEAKGLTLQVGHVERFNPAFEAVRGEVSSPKFIQATRTSGYTFRSTDIGVVLDVMIHDIDLAISLAASPVVEVQAMGLSVLGGHEDMVDARLRFANGCVAHLTASRVSYQQQRTMQVFSDRAFAAIDFQTRKATTLHPRPDVLARQFSVPGLDAAQVEHYRENLFDTLLVKSEHEWPAVNAIGEELKDFARAITTGDPPRVSGVAARDALAVAEQILDSVATHAWDGKRVGAFASPRAGESITRAA